MVAEISQDLLHSKTIDYIQKLLAPVLERPAADVDAIAPMETFGIRPIMELTRQLEAFLGRLPKTLFFEYQNLDELAGYLAACFPDPVMQMLGITETRVIADIKEGPAIPGHLSQDSAFVQTTPFDIAIIGLSGQYPLANTIGQFWERLASGSDCICEIPKDRWNHDLYFDPDKKKPFTSNSMWGGFLSGVDQFDPLFFNIAPQEAEFMDPQERLFLQCAFETMEDAGYTRESIGTREKNGAPGPCVGVFVGTMYEEYGQFGARIFANPASIANRVSSFFNFSGPSMALDTMCASSLTTIHLACQSIRQGECTMALAGGVNVSIHPNKYLMLNRLKFSS
ncbi:MAG: type I polyketide synthase, partial [Proteobacteria bacterium]|nr:type I polyketide synthase [Pseudomonadota bacterium]